MNIKFKRVSSWASAAHVYNPSYLGGRNQEHHSSKPAKANSSKDPISKKPITKKKGWWSGSRYRPEFKFKPQYHKTKIKTKKASIWN
jgi:hypothetical protein